MTTLAHVPAPHRSSPPHRRPVRSTHQARRLRFASAGLVLVLGTLVSALAATAQAPAPVHRCDRSPTVSVSIDHEARLYRLYCAAFGREPDAEGLAFWSERFTQRFTLRSAAAFFADSTEFVERYGETTDQQFLDVLYNNVFLREPDAGGLAFWLGELSTGTTRSEVLLFFSDSPEMRDQTQLDGSYDAHQFPDYQVHRNWRDGSVDAIVLITPVYGEGERVPLIRGRAGAFFEQGVVEYWNDLYDAAQADGIRLVSNGTYRSYDAQLETRRRNGCADIYLTPPEDCSVPTSIPGNSQHNHGRAIDFNLGQSSPGAVQWMVDNAHRYGFYGFKSKQVSFGGLRHESDYRNHVGIEPWHWDTTGALHRHPPSHATPYFDEPIWTD